MLINKPRCLLWPGHDMTDHTLWLSGTVFDILNLAPHMCLRQPGLSEYWVVRKNTEQIPCGDAFLIKNVNAQKYVYIYTNINIFDYTSLFEHIHII